MTDTKAETRPSRPLEISEADLRRLQSVQRELLALILDRCAEIDVSAVTIAGTALGAVRHGDTIPWDDDVDIGLLRGDYETLLSSLIERPITGTVLQAHTTEDACPFAFAKLRKTGTRVYGEVLDHMPISHGIGLDIFPLDLLPSSKVARRIQRSSLWLCRAVILSSRPYINASSTTYIRSVRRILAPVYDFLPIRKLKNARDWLSEWPIGKHTNTTVSWEMYGLQGSHRTEVDVDKIFPVAYAKFGDLVVPIPRDHHSYLTKVFGDYMTLPPVAERRPPHLRRVVFDEPEHSATAG